MDFSSSILEEYLLCEQSCRAARVEQPCVVIEYGILEVCILYSPPDSSDIDMAAADKM